jgi:hypothetical protein
MSEHCSFCGARPVLNGLSWVSPNEPRVAPCPRCGAVADVAQHDDTIDLTTVWAALEAVCDCGALAASATFLTSHGLVAVAMGPRGRALSVNGERIPLEPLP